jgi:hypothetical protein
MPMHKKKPADPITDFGFGWVDGHGIVALGGLAAMDIQGIIGSVQRE